MVNLSPEEKREMCIELARYLPRIRQILKMSQHEFSQRVGTSKERLSAIENGRYIMRWSLLCSILFFMAVNKDTKDYFFDQRILSPKLLQYLQLKDKDCPPDVNVVSERAMHYINPSAVS